MIFVPVEQLRVGMVIAKSIESDGETCVIPLLARGHVLTERLINKLKEKNITGAYIETDFSDDITPGEIISPQVKRKPLSESASLSSEITQYSKIFTR
jgi:hypothetical protein